MFLEPISSNNLSDENDEDAMLPYLLTEHVLSLLCKHLMLYVRKEQTLERWVTALGSGNIK